MREAGSARGRHCVRQGVGEAGSARGRQCVRQGVREAGSARGRQCARQAVREAGSARGRQCVRQGVHVLLPAEHSHLCHTSSGGAHSGAVKLRACRWDRYDHN